MAVTPNPLVTPPVTPGRPGLANIRDNEPRAEVELFASDPAVTDENAGSVFFLLTITVAEGLQTPASASAKIRKEPETTAEGGFVDPANPTVLIDEIEVPIPEGLSSVVQIPVEFRLVDNALEDGNKEVVLRVFSLRGGSVTFGDQLEDRVVVRDDETGSNSDPRISRIFFQTVNVSEIAMIPFTVEDFETDPDNLAIEVIADDMTLLPESGIQVTGAGTNRILVLTPTPGREGRTEVTITVTDEGGHTAVEMFTLRVRGEPPVISPIDDITVAASADRFSVDFTITDRETEDFADFEFDLRSSNQEVIPNESLQVRQILPLQNSGKIRGDGRAYAASLSGRINTASPDEPVRISAILEDLAVSTSSFGGAR